jgi:chromosomal replication initiator protein
VGSEIWKNCLDRLEFEIPSQQFDTCIRPLQVEEAGDGLQLFSPNKYIMDLVSDMFLSRIKELASDYGVENVFIEVGSKLRTEKKRINGNGIAGSITGNGLLRDIDMEFTFATFVEGRSNVLARAAAVQVAENVGTTYNPLLLYGGVGLGKTHLMCAVGNAIRERNPEAIVVYTNSQRFIEEMVRAIETGQMREFTEAYRSIDVLLMDDIQFLAKGSKSQEEFFHLFNRLQEDGRQIVLTCDKYPKEIVGLEERLKSRFVSSMTAPVEPPDLETRVAILRKKAAIQQVDLSQDVAFFIAERIRSNVRELEGALKRVIANAVFTGSDISIAHVRDSLKDLLAMQDRQVGIENIQKTVADYFKIRVSDLHSKKRNRSITRPRQLAMALAKELTNHSLPEIGDSFGGRDHTTVLHACRKIEELRESTNDMQEDYNNVLRLLTH